MNMRRPLAATIAACLASWLVMCAGLLVIIPMFSGESVIPFFLMCLPAPFAFALIVGWPTRTLLQRKGTPRLKPYLITGAIEGALLALAYSFLAARNNTLDVCLMFLAVSALHLSITTVAGYAVFWALIENRSPNKASLGIVANASNREG